ncbi:MAG: hybrid sensor histidine kinase/response regulator [Anaerolineae bacterium]|nr:hybrid sensor histidine kinase/response regulator [Anaerolineae bacterium]
MPQTLIATKPRILYIDDDPLNRSLVNRVLTNYDFEVIEAETGLEGIKIATKEVPDLILMDINMPGLDGHETTTRMRTISGLQRTPIVALTAYATKGDRELALTAGCDGYINKPIDVDNFPNQIVSYLEGQKDTISKDEQQHYLDQYSKKLVERLETKILELEDANTRLQKVDKLKSDFITVASHELRTPMTLVYGYARLLQSAIKESDQAESTEKHVVSLVQKIYKSVHRLNEVVNDVLNVFLIEASSMQLQHQRVHVGKLINSALDELNPNKNNRTLHITLKNVDELPEIVGDAERLKQVFWNLLSNAIKFTPDHGRIFIEGQVTKAENPHQTGGQIIITIKDTGIGLAPSEQKEIFDRFYMVEDTTYHSSSKTAFGGGGIGLGLPIAKGIIEAHGGRIWAESAGYNTEQNPGSTFYVLLPLHPEQSYS